MWLHREYVSYLRIMLLHRNRYARPVLGLMAVKQTLPRPPAGHLVVVPLRIEDAVMLSGYVQLRMLRQVDPCETRVVKTGQASMLADIGANEGIRRGVWPLGRKEEGGKS